MNDLFDNAWENKKQVVVDHCLDITLPVSFSLSTGWSILNFAQLALFVISAAGFGRKMSWKDDKVLPSGHQMTFKSSLYTVTTYVIHRIMLPDWAMGLTEKTREIALGFRELRVRHFSRRWWGRFTDTSIQQSHMTEMIETRKRSEKVERHDLFSNLLEANSSDGETENLSADELIGTTFQSTKSCKMLKLSRQHFHLPSCWPWSTLIL